MDDLTDAEYEAATERGRQLLKNTPLAAAVRYDRDADRIVIDLNNGSTFSFPPKFVQGLEGATAEQLGAVWASGAGYGLHWDELDVDFTVPGLMAGRFGTARYMAERFGAGWNAVAAE